MTKVLKRKEMIDLIEKAMTVQDNFIVKLQSDDNPQVKELVALAKGRQFAYGDVLAALRGEPVFLRIMAE